jgi:hypothetical protein
MTTNRTHTKLQRTLLILLGILIACLLTLNVGDFYSHNSLHAPVLKDTQTPYKNPDVLGRLLTRGMTQFREKISSLK